MRLLMVVFALCACMYAPSASAQDKSSAGDAVALPQSLSKDNITDLVSTLDDKQARALLLKVLADLGEKSPVENEKQPDTSFTSAIQNEFLRIGEALRDAVYKAPALPGGLMQAVSNFRTFRGGDATAVVALFAAIALAAAVAAEFIARFATRNWRNRLADKLHDGSLSEQAGALYWRILVEIAFLALFTAIVYGGMAWIWVSNAKQTVMEFLYAVIILPRWIMLAFNLVLSPGDPAARLVNADDWTSQYLSGRIVGNLALMGLGAFLVDFQSMNGVPLAQTQIGTWALIVNFIWIGFAVWRTRLGLARMMRGFDTDLTPLEASFARLYPTLFLLLIFAMALVALHFSTVDSADLANGYRHYITLGVFALMPVVDTAIISLVHRLVPPMRGEGGLAEQAFLSATRAYVRICRVIALAAGAIILSRVWEFELSGIGARGIGAIIPPNLMPALGVFAIGYLAWELVTLWINKRLSNEQTTSEVLGEDVEPTLDQEHGSSRLATVLPLIRIFAQVAIAVLTVLLALGQIGIDITPLLAGAGIVGLAIGFGAQTLVKDIVSGLFFLMDDAFRVGEYIVIGDTVGTVEKISLRSMQLRHHTGPVHTIPYGGIARVTNNSRDWVIVKMKFTVPFNTDMRKVKKIFKTIGADVLNEPYGADIIETFKLQGVGDVNDVGIVIRGKFKARPNRQWVARKEIYARVQNAFHENDIEFARREVRVNVSGSSGTTTTTDQLAGAAAYPWPNG